MLKAPIALALLATTLFTAATLKFDAPAAWVSKTPSSTMRVAEYTLPRAAGDTEDATVTVFFFGSRMGGDVQANLDRWTAQFAQPDGRSSKDLAKTASFTANGLAVTTLDVSGTFVAEVSPGSAEHFNKPGFRQIAAVVQTTGGPYFMKLVGPQATVAKWADDYTAFLKSSRFE